MAGSPDTPPADPPENRIRLAAILDQLPAGVVLADADGTVLWWNRRATAIFGRRPERCDIGSLGFAQSDGRAYERNALPLRRALDRGETVIGEMAFIDRSDGTRLQVRTSAVPVADADRRITSAVLAIEDVTEQARRERDSRLLAAVTDALGEPGNLEELLERIADVAVPSFADVCGVYLLQGDELQLLAVALRQTEELDALRRHFSRPVPLTSATPIAEAARTRRAVMLDAEIETFTREALEPGARLDWVDQVLQPRSLLAVPMHGRDRVIGVLSFSQTTQSDRRFVPEDFELAGELARRVALLVEQVVAHTEIAMARDRADHLRQFAAAMARAPSVDAVVRATIEHGGVAVGAQDVNVVLRLRNETTVRIHHARWPHGPRVTPGPMISVDRKMPITDSLQHNRANYLSDRDQFVAEYPELADDLDTVALRAVATVPLLDSGGDVLGAIAFAFSSAQLFDDDQRSLLQTAADVTAQSLDRARLYERERDVARTLQLALLPAALPSLDDIRIEARYVAGGADVTVGGDWYDVLRFDDDRIGLLIGDAAGRGIEAATFMGKVRNAAAALAMEHASPARVLQRVNDYLHTMSSRRSMLTCCYIVVDPDRRTLRYASAGHPPPLLRGAGDDMIFLDQARGVPLGVVAGAQYEDAEHVLTDASTLILYTDGLVERRGESIDDGLARLRDTVEAFDGEVERLCDHLTASLLGEHSEDDVALLVARLVPVAPRVPLAMEVPADIAQLANLRHRLARWLHDSGVGRSIADDILVAVNEAVSNSMLHAYSNGDQHRGPDTETGSVRVAVEVDGDSLSAVVVDRGSWRGRPDHHDGRGLQLMRALMSEVSVDTLPNGTSVRMTRKLSG